jgi:hypothetical protein
MRQCVPGCIHVPHGGDLLCRTHWRTVSLEQRRLLWIQFLRWQHGEITEKQYQKAALRSLNTASVIPAATAGLELHK